jgi:hypothetical protein
MQLLYRLNDICEMKRGKRFFKSSLFSILILISTLQGNSQRYLSGLDTTMFIKDTLRPILKRFENIRISGYMQPQYQVAQSAGISSYEGGNFSQFSRSRFMIRRARVKIDYLMASKDQMPRALFTFQIDGSERGVAIRDVFIRLYETWKNNFSLITGFFSRPFGYEVNLSSSFRETPERGRMSQILMPGERDLGVALIFEPQVKTNKLYHVRWDGGFFNGQGQSGTTDFDSRKDFISRLTIKPFSLGKSELSGGVSLLLGGWKNATKYVYNVGVATNGDKLFVVDSSNNNLGTSSPRHYYGADMQYKIHHDWGETELRGEYWFGTQPGTATSTTNPGTIPTVNGLPAPTYVRHIDGAFFYFLQNIINNKHQLIVKYDWYDPNIKVENTEIGKSTTNFTLADIKYYTLGLGYAFNINPQTKLVFYYDVVRNEKTNLAGYTSDLKDNVFTSRLQFRF